MKILLSPPCGIPEMYIVVLIFSLSLVITIGCTKASRDNDPDITTTSYSEDQTNFSNPERGFFSQQASYSDSPSPTLPSSMAPGVYDVLLNLPDPEPDLNSKPEYSIRFANKNVWEPGTGYNS